MTPGRTIRPGRVQLLSEKAGREAMPIQANDDVEKARRFRDAALPYLDVVCTLPLHLLHDASDAEYAVQECYLRPLKHFYSYRGPPMKPCLLAILLNDCRAEF